MNSASDLSCANSGRVWNCSSQANTGAGTAQDTKLFGRSAKYCARISVAEMSSFGSTSTKGHCGNMRR